MNLMIITYHLMSMLKFQSLKTCEGVGSMFVSALVFSRVGVKEWHLYPFTQIHLFLYMTC